MSRITEICDAVAGYLQANRTTLPVLVADAWSKPVTYHHAEKGTGPWLFVYPIETTTEIDTRDDYRTLYGVAVTVSKLLPVASDDDLEQMQTLTHAVKDLLREVPMHGADFWQVGGETAQPEFAIDDEMQGQYFVSTLLLDYVDFH